MSAQGLLAVGVPPQPLWLLYIKIAILVFSLIALALGAYALSFYGGYAGYYGGGGAAGMDIFIAIWSFIIYGGGAALELWAPQFFYRIASLIGQILAIIFWLSAWAWSASTAAAWSGLGSYYGGNKYSGAYGGAAGVGAIVWILTIVHLVFFIRASISDTTPSGQAELGQVKVEVPPQQYQQQPYPVQPQQQPYPPQAQQPYVQQPYVQQPYPQQA